MTIADTRTWQGALVCCVIGLALVCGAWLFVTPGLAQIEFDVARDFALGGQRTVRLADFDKDGYVDVAFARENQIVIFRNDGADRLTNVGWSLTLPFTTSGFDVGDLNGDGHLDIVATDRDAWIAFGDANVQFGAPVEYLIADFPAGVKIADIDGDSDADVVLFDDAFVQFLVGDGAGSFTVSDWMGVGGDVRQVAFADVTDDGVLDLLFSSTQVGYLVGTGSGQFHVDFFPQPIATLLRTVVGDFNGDGAPDLVSAQTGRDLAFRGNDGSGGFLPIVLTEVDSNLGDLQVADLDGDAQLDVVGFADDETLSISYGRGDGTFDSEQFLTIPDSSVGHLAIDDVQGDGTLDLIVTRRSTDEIVVFLGTGSRTFGSPISSATPSNPRRFATGDFDDDGNLDLILSHGFEISMMPGDGTGGFSAPVLVGGLGEPSVIRSGDLDENGDLDLVMKYDDAVLLYSGDGSGGFTAGGTLPIPDPYDDDGDMILSDLDGDGHLDIALSDRTLFVYQGDGAGGFASPVASGLPSTAPDLGAADFDGDGRIDLVARTEQPLNGHLLLRGSNDGFGPNVRFTGLGDGGRFHLRDLNHDGVDDLLLGREGVSYYEGRPTGGFLPRVRTELPFGTELTVADFDDDGHVDAAMLGEFHRVEVVFGDGTGTFADARTLVTRDWSYYLEAADITNDGRPDLIAGGQTSQYVIPNAGDRDFLNGATTEVDCGSFAEAMVGGDFDEDGHFDLAVLGNATLEVLLGVGDGTFVPGGSAPAGQGPSWMTTADFDGNGTLDIAAVIQSLGELRVYLGDGAGSFTLATSSPLVDTPFDIATQDFDGDGFVDVAVAASAAGAVDVGFGDGTGSFPVWTRTTGLVAPKGLVAGNFDPLNGAAGVHPDLMVVDSGASAVTFVRGNGDRTFDVAFSFGATPDAFTIHTVDADRNGVLDVVIGNWTALEVTLRTNTGFGTFLANPITRTLLGRSTHLASGDLNGDKIDDLLALSIDGESAILLGDGAGYGRSFGLGGTWTPKAVSPVIGDFDEDGSNDFAFALREAGGALLPVVSIHRNVSFAAHRCRAGNVNQKNDDVRRDVLFVNGSRGDGTSRETSIDASEAIEVTLDAAPIGARGDRYFVAVWADAPDSVTVTPMPKRIGFACFAPLVPDPAYIVPLHVANTLLPSDPRLAPPTMAATGDPIPGTVLELGAGDIAPGARITVQGVLGDGNAISPKKVSMTNAVVVTIE